MRGYLRKFCMQVALIACALAVTSARCAESATVEVQGIAASDPGKRTSIPASLQKYKSVLESMPYGTFVDLGRKTASGPGRQSATLGKYTVDLNIHRAGENKASVTVAIKDGAQSIGQPVKYTLAQNKPQIIEAGSKDSKTVFVLTLQSTE